MGNHYACWKEYFDDVPEITIQYPQLPALSKSSPTSLGSMTLKSIREKIINPDTRSLHLPTRISKLQSMVPSGKELRLKVKNSQKIAKNLVININYKGYMDSSTIGVVYFGNKRKDSKSGKRVNDFVIQSDESLYGQLFVIFYSEESDEFYIRDLGLGQGVYLKLDYSYKLTSDILINIGETHLYFKIVLGSNSYPNLVLTVFTVKDSKTYCFYAQEQHIAPIRIGRASDCDISINDMLLSKYQASILYSHSQGWMLIDGNIIRQRPSTNGAWLYCSNDTLLSSNSEIKFASNLFKVQVTS